MEDNKLIAEFMGLESSGSEDVWINVFDSSLVPLDWKEWCSIEIRNDENCIRIPSLYHTSWDWLMPVVSQITRDDMLIENEYRESIMDTVPYGLIEDTYKVVVEFIKWYNQNK